MMACDNNNDSKYRRTLRASYISRFLSRLILLEQEVVHRHFFTDQSIQFQFNLIQFSIKTKFYIQYQWLRDKNATENNYYLNMQEQKNVNIYSID